MRLFIALVALLLLLGLGSAVLLHGRAQAAEEEALQARHAAESAHVRAEEALARVGVPGSAPTGTLEEQNEALRLEVDTLRAEAAALLAEIEAAGGRVDETLEERLRRIALQRAEDGDR